jgi:hypothetical protein
MVAFTLLFFQISKGILLLIVLFTIIGGITTFFLIQFLTRLKIKKKIKRGIKLEHDAQTFLIQQGYSIQAYHLPISYTLNLDNKPITIGLELDYIISKNGKTYVAEVKSGEHTATVYYAQTRRQILEYAIATKYDGYLLIDMHHKKIHKIQFPLEKQYFIPTYIKIGVILIASTILLFTLMLQKYYIYGNIGIVIFCIILYNKMKK